MSPLPTADANHGDLAHDHEALTALQGLLDACKDGTIDRLCDRLGIELLGSFGSAVVAWHANQRGEHDSLGASPHDLDIAVQFAGPLRPLETLDALTALTSYDHIDLAVMNDADPVLRAAGLTGIGLFERERGAWAEAQIQAVAERRDTAWLRHLDLLAMSGRRPSSITEWYADWQGA